MVAMLSIMAPQLPALTTPVDYDDIALQDSIANVTYNEQRNKEMELYVPIVASYRTYGDSITLRWAINSYPEWRYLTRTGVDVVRLNTNGQKFKLDTLARALKPLSLEQFRAAYPNENDSLAYLAMGAVYGQGYMTLENTPYYSGTVEAATELAEDQKMFLIAAFLSADRRPDLANALALRFTDHKVKKGEKYDYYIIPSRPDTTGHIFIHSALINNVVNEPYKPEQYNVTVTDSITGHGEVVLSWTDGDHGLFEIYRRRVGDKQWTHANSNPYAPPFIQSDSEVIYTDRVSEIGDYEYRVQAHDAFGDMTQLSSPIRVHFPDMQAPHGPEISLIVIDRPDKLLADSKIFANIYFHKDSIERDFTHYVPLYANSTDSLRQWRLLSNQYIAPTDTMIRVDVTNVRTGMVTIAAADTAGNLGYAMPKLMRVADLRPPKAPTNLKADAKLDGTVLLTWEMEDTLDLHYYDVFYSNSPDHEFVKLNDKHVYGRSFMDTIAVDANERYIYYSVRGVDVAMNQGSMSETLRVLRPNTATPEMVHLDSMWVDDTMIHVRWMGVGSEMVSNYDVYRRLEGAKEWELIRSFDADSVASVGYTIQLDDAVKPNPHRGYEYAVQTVSMWGLTSGLSPVLTARLVGNRMVDFPLSLDGMYDNKKKMTKIAWSADTSKLDEEPDSKGFYYCIWRQGPYDDGFNYVINAPSDQHSYVDYLLQPGESAQYRISVRFRDGRRGPTSNTITVTAPKTSSN